MEKREREREKNAKFGDFCSFFAFLLNIFPLVWKKSSKTLLNTLCTCMFIFFVFFVLKTWLY